jgi:hypothetical protein
MTTRTIPTWSDCVSNFNRPHFFLDSHVSIAALLAASLCSATGISTIGIDDPDEDDLTDFMMGKPCRMLNASAIETAPMTGRKIETKLKSNKRAWAP